MSALYRTLLRPVLFAQDSEKIHNRTLGMLAWAGRHPSVRGLLRSFFQTEELPTEVFGLKFPNPVGLAAGMDKHAAALPVWEALGFGFCELGGVTRHPQPGNPEPRMFRAVKERALINRMGFNNFGADAMAVKLADWRSRGLWPKHPVGINLGKSKITPLNESAEDYVYSLKALWAHADFFVVNVSSPNTPNLRQLQDKAALDEILAALQATNRALAATPKPTPWLEPCEDKKRPKPILVKVAPDLSFEALDEILELAGPRQIAGVIATNTTIARPETNEAATQKVYSEAGGLSGRPLSARSTEVIRHIYRQTKGKLTIVGVGGIFDANDAWEKITAGASLVQVYTGLVYEGPAIVGSIASGLQSRLKTEGMHTIAEAVGSKSG